MFNINDKVVCVDDSPGRATPGYRDHQLVGKPSGLTLGAVYVVKGADRAVSGVPIVFLVGFNLGVNAQGVPIGFWAERFRLVSEVQAENRAKRSESTRHQHPA